MTHHSGVSSHNNIYVPLFVMFVMVTFMCHCLSQSKGFNPREEDVGWILAIHNAVNEQGELVGVLLETLCTSDEIGQWAPVCDVM